MNKDELIKYLAQILAGLQVPYSLDSRMLGSAADPWLMVKQAVGFGWLDEADFQAWLEGALV